ncbi:MAG: hypothetical protein COY58_08480 [Gammaproteobacteria bacterium CG_4_10_14_0_8_um_filter_38_16]|nr:MAG: hypothetical protein COY58_08480 [Gammaproteobacteria bacterium CG_4_10_14_0_8_um_filter_38_16]
MNQKTAVAKRRRTQTSVAKGGAEAERSPKRHRLSRVGARDDTSLTCGSRALANDYNNTFVSADHILL